MKQRKSFNIINPEKTDATRKRVDIGSYLLTVVILSSVYIALILITIFFLPIPENALPAVITGYGVILGLAAASVLVIKKTRSNEDLNDANDVVQCEEPCRKGVSVYKDRESTELKSKLKSINPNSKITIFTIHLSTISEWFTDDDIVKALGTNKPQVNVYALNPYPVESNDMFKILYTLYSKDNADELKESMDRALRNFKDGIKTKYIKGGYKSYGENEICLHLFDYAVDVPLPLFQYYSLNELVYVNPLSSVYINDETFISEVPQTDGTTPKDRLHIMFNREILDEHDKNGYLGVYDKLLDFYIGKSKKVSIIQPIAMN